MPGCTDPHLRGDADLPNPEQLLVLAAPSCQLLVEPVVVTSSPS